jgi:hypothetical protein
MQQSADFLTMADRGADGAHHFCAQAQVGDDDLDGRCGGGLGVAVEGVAEAFEEGRSGGAEFSAELPVSADDVAALDVLVETVGVAGDRYNESFMKMVGL